MSFITPSAYPLLLEPISSSIAELIFPIIFTLIGISLFIRPLWIFELWFLQMKILGISEDTVPDMKKMKLKMKDEDDYDFQMAKMVARLIGIIALLMALFSFWGIIKDLITS